MCVMLVYGCRHAMVYIWKLKDTFWGLSFLPPYTRGRILLAVSAPEVPTRAFSQLLRFFRNAEITELNYSQFL